jgi:Tfp pilus assembly PilM family ATPase
LKTTTPVNKVSELALSQGSVSCTTMTEEAQKLQTTQYPNLPQNLNSTTKPYDHSESVKQSITKPFVQEIQQPNKTFFRKVERTQEVC